MNSKKDFPQTELQEKIYNFWSIRGFSKVKAFLGNIGVTFHRENLRYEKLGIDYIYLEQFQREAKEEVIKDFEEYLKETTYDDYATQCEMFIDKIKEKHLENSIDVKKILEDE